MLFWLLGTVFAIAQPYHPDSSNPSIGIGFHKTTLLLFPSPIEDADRGQKDISIARQKGIQNAIKLKATRKGFITTNLHVFCKDGSIYTFDVYYAEPEGNTTTLDVRNIFPAPPIKNPMPVIFPEIEEATQRKERLWQIRNTRPFFSAKVTKFDMRLKLYSIHFDADQLYFHYKLENKSNIPYLLDFSRMYITDARKIKRSSVQQLEIVPVFGTNEKLVPGNSTTDFIFATKRFTIPSGKRFMVEFFEKNGGRHLSLNIRNRHIFKAKPLFGE